MVKAAEILLLLKQQHLPLRSGETPPGVLHPALEPSAHKTHGPVGAGPEKGDKDDLRAGAPLL